MTCNNKKINDLRKLEVTKVKVKNVLLSIKVDTSQLKLQKLKQKEKISKEKPYFGKKHDSAYLTISRKVIWLIWLFIICLDKILIQKGYFYISI